MPQWSYDDRNVLDAESCLWVAYKILDRLEAGAWTERIAKVREDLRTLAKELQEYNEQWEGE